MKRKPILGETLYSLNVGNSAGHCLQVLKPVEVVKVGRKYFSTKLPGYSWIIEYHVDTWAEKTNYAPNRKLYESEQEWLDESEAYSLLESIKAHFAYGNPKHSLEILREVARLIQGGG